MLVHVAQVALGHFVSHLGGPSVAFRGPLVGPLHALAVLVEVTQAAETPRVAQIGCFAVQLDGPLQGLFSAFPLEPQPQFQDAIRIAVFRAKLAVVRLVGLVVVDEIRAQDPCGLPGETVAGVGGHPVPSESLAVGRALPQPVLEDEPEEALSVHVPVLGLILEKQHRAPVIGRDPEPGCHPSL